MDVEVDDEVGELVGVRDPDVDLWDAEGEFTGFKIQRLTCLFRLDATPKRRPHVSQTKAKEQSHISARSPGLQWGGEGQHTLFTSMYEKMLK